MRTNFILGTALLMAGMVAGCSDDPAPTDAGTDLGNTVDTGAPADTGTATDTGSPVDSGSATDTGAAVDTGSAVDTGAGTDVGTQTDAGTDSGTATDTGPADSGAGTDAGPAIATINGCTPAMYVDHSAGTRTITFGSSFTYDPRCMTITAGQTVTFSGTFSSHPLVAGSVSGDPAGTTPNPITNTNTGASATFTFAAPGLYPYFCNFHQPGMAGVIQVR
ncbi:MAG: plastocyanin/azurin family copper-binding protein [Deltaproteobacteria bacterium]|nr:plastocyanin/azurin family copper-binding protein [Myxococcales bacterium]MDP3217835.1 plastocyanin/azurin family copper-binding protein [Deltaproteobacteria bacterium]